MVQAIIREIELRKEEFQDDVTTLYFGGGTPSLLDESDLNAIFNALSQYISLEKLEEITLEANPDDLIDEKLKQLSNSLVNRLSIGVQSFFDVDLQFMNRAHSSSEAEKSIKKAQDLGFDNITIDLIYGSNTTTNEMWQHNLEKAIALSVPHISSYALTVEPKTKLDFDVHTKKIKEMDEEHQNEQFVMLQSSLKSNDFIQYEISNFGKENFFSKHNTNYWKNIPYIGLGPSAHSFDGESRKWNVANNGKYLKSLKENILPLTIEKLSEKERYNELVMIGLRTIWGIDKAFIEKTFSSDIVLEFQKELKILIEEGYLEVDENRVKVKKNKLFYADGIASRLFYI